VHSVMWIFSNFSLCVTRQTTYSNFRSTDRTTDRPTDRLLLARMVGAIYVNRFLGQRISRIHVSVVYFFRRSRGIRYWIRSGRLQILYSGIICIISTVTHNYYAVLFPTESSDIVNKLWCDNGVPPPPQSSVSCPPRQPRSLDPFLSYMTTYIILFRTAIWYYY